MEDPVMLDNIEALHMAAVLADCTDQLAILGKIMPVSFQNRPDADEIVSAEIGNLVSNQHELESKYENMMTKKEGMRGTSAKNTDKMQPMENAKSTLGDLRNSTNMFGRGLKQSPLTMDNLEKVQADRAFLEYIFSGTLSEMKEHRSFGTLINAVRSAKEKKASLQNTIQQEEEGRLKVKKLKAEILEVKKEKERELQERSEMIAHLKDQLQELKAKTNMEGKYIKKCAEVSVSQTQKKCNLSEKQCREEIEELEEHINEETRVNTEIENFLKQHTENLQAKVEFWSNKHEKDVDAKQHELDVLKASKAKDLSRLQELTKLYSEYEQVVVEDRIEKEKARRKAEQEAEELRAAIKVQAWFRGVMVRKCLGPYSKKKKKKGKKGKSGKKKKK